MMDPKWLDWVRRLQAIAQNGLTYSKDPYDIDRYNTLLDIAAEIAASQEPVSAKQVRGIFARVRHRDGTALRAAISLQWLGRHRRKQVWP